MSPDEYFRGKTCVVTGAAAGIGYAVSEALLQLGATVFLADRDEARLDEAVEKLGEHAGRVHAATVDVTRFAEVEDLIRRAASVQGHLDVVFNNAGIGGTLPIGEATLEHWRKIIDINLWGVIHGIHAALPIMRHQGGGHIVNTSSLSGLLPIPYQALYAATKYGVVGLSECLRLELADEGIRVSVVCPGAVATRIWGQPLLGEYVERKPPPDAIPAEEAARTILAAVADGVGIIVLPEQMRTLWQRYGAEPEVVERALMDLARERRRAYETKGTFY